MSLWLVKPWAVHGGNPQQSVGCSGTFTPLTGEDVSLSVYLYLCVFQLWAWMLNRATEQSCASSSMRWKKIMNSVTKVYFLCLYQAIITGVLLKPIFPQLTIN